MDDHELMRATELGEAAYMYAAFAGTTAEVKATLGMNAALIGGGAVTVMADDPTGGFWSRVIGLGITEPVTRAVVDEVISFAREADAKSLVWQIAPKADGPWEEILTATGARPSAAWVKFAARTADLHPAATTDLRIAPVDPGDAQRWGEVMTEGFEMPMDSALPAWYGTLPSIPGFRTYGAWDGDALVAGSGLFTKDGIGTLSGAATLHDYRGRGAQGALMTRRIADAAAAGCEWITAETGAETPEDPNPSLHNMRRIGLVELYERRNWLWRPSSD